LRIHQSPKEVVAVIEDIVITRYLRYDISFDFIFRYLTEFPLRLEIRETLAILFLTEIQFHRDSLFLFLFLLFFAEEEID